ncbi:MerR family transcriptional regulator [Streptomyces polyrhachis]|uniref:MerR family transcriptional regulator n=1 Tax=Streptomyces polyrhachis TaxID=1282885 RepID=A0ABW2GKD2_9ACTN
MGQEFRMAELAEAAGVPVRTVRFYRERKLLQPPRKEGRIAWYGEAHLERLRTITALLERGHTLGGIAELLCAFESGRDVRGAAELLGFEMPLVRPWSEETPVRLTPQELADYFGDEVSGENLTASLDIGYLAIDGEEFVHASRRLLDVSAALVREGVPLSVVLAAGRGVRRHADELAEMFTDLIRDHLFADVLGTDVLGADADGPDPGRLTEIADTVERLRPMAKSILEAEVAMAMDRRLRTETERWQRGGKQADGTDRTDGGKDAD